MLAVSSLATYGILLAGLIISPSIMRIICRKQGELQEKLKPSQSAAKLIYYKSERSTTSRFDSTTSALGLIFYLFFI
jgi:hypothetical protein